MCGTSSNVIQWLTWLADYRVLSASQMAVLMNVPSRSVRRNLRRLVERGWLDVIFRPYNDTRGRPENLYCLTRRGVDQLKEAGILDSSLPYARIIWEGKLSLDHQLSVNWVLIAAFHLQQSTNVTIQSLSQTSPLLPQGRNGGSFLAEKLEEDGEESAFIPDAAIALHHPQGKSDPLFFLEVDRSTEPLAGNRSPSNSIRQKIVHYQTYHRLQGFKRYEEIFGYSFQGFRLLLVCDSPSRLEKLALLVHNTPSTNFVWLTEEDDILQHGFGDCIWVKGGQLHEPRKSLLGEEWSVETPLFFSEQVREANG